MSYVNPKNILIELEWAEAALRRAKEEEVEAIHNRENAEERLRRAKEALRQSRESGAPQW